MRSAGHDSFDQIWSELYTEGQPRTQIISIYEVLALTVQTEPIITTAASRWIKKEEASKKASKKSFAAPDKRNSASRERSRQHSTRETF